MTSITNLAAPIGLVLSWQTLVTIDPAFTSYSSFCDFTDILDSVIFRASQNCTVCKARCLQGRSKGIFVGGCVTDNLPTCRLFRVADFADLPICNSGTIFERKKLLLQSEDFFSFSVIESF